MKKMRKGTALFLALCSLILLFAGCGKSASDAALSCGSVSISRETYRYWLATFKYYFVTHYEDLTDTTESWNRDLGDGRTAAEYLEDYTLQYAKTMIGALMLFDEYKLKLDSSAVEEIDDTINEMIYYRYNDSKAAFNAALMDTYGITVTDLREALLIEAKGSAVENYLYGDNGKELPTNEELTAYYNAHYMRAGMVAVNTEFEYIKDLDGNYKFDDSGKAMTTDLNDEQKAEKRALAANIEERVKAGEDILALTKEYAPEEYENYPDGYYFCPEDYTSYVNSGYTSQFMTAILQLKDGEVKTYEEDGMIYIVKRLPLIDGAYADKQNETQFRNLQEYVITEKYKAKIAELIEDVTVSDYVRSLKAVDIKKGFI